MPLLREMISMSAILQKFPHTQVFFKKLGLEERDIKVYLFCLERPTVTFPTLVAESELSEKELKHSLKSLHSKHLIEIHKKEKHVKVRALAFYPLILSLIDFVSEAIERFQTNLPRALEKQLKHIEEKGYDHKSIGDFEEYLSTIKSELPEIIEKEYNRYHQILNQAHIFQEVQQCIQKMEDAFALTERIILEEVGSERSFFDHYAKKIEKRFEKEFGVGELTSISTAIFKELMREHFESLTESYLQRLKSIIDKKLIQSVLPKLEQLSEIADQVSSDLDIAFMAIRTGMKAILSDLDSKIRKTHAEVDSKIHGLPESFKKALKRSFTDGTIKQLLDFLTVVKEGLQELRNIYQNREK